MIITAYAGPGAKAEFLKQGAAAFLEKSSLDAAQLRSEVTRVLAEYSRPRKPLQSATRREFRTDHESDRYT
jgi:hypothetical protein